MTPASAMHACGEALQAQTATLETLAGDHLDPILAGMEDAARGCLSATATAFDRAVEIMGDLAKNLDARLEEFRGRLNAAMGCLSKPVIAGRTDLMPAEWTQRKTKENLEATQRRAPEETPTVQIEPAIAALNRPEASIDAPTAPNRLTEMLTPGQVDALPEADLDERIRREVAEACPGFPHEVATAACSPVAPPSPLCGCGEWDCPECGKRPKPAKPRGKGKPRNARS